MEGAEAQNLDPGKVHDQISLLHYFRHVFSKAPTETAGLIPVDGNMVECFFLNFEDSKISIACCRNCEMEQQNRTPSPQKGFAVCVPQAQPLWMPISSANINRATRMISETLKTEAPQP